MNNREKAELIYHRLKEKGAGIGNASITIIDKALCEIGDIEDDREKQAIVDAFQSVGGCAYCGDTTGMECICEPDYDGFDPDDAARKYFEQPENITPYD